MLAEMKNVLQIKNEPQRRWFASPYFDLIVWHDDSREIVGFQLCYEKHLGERAFTWRKSRGFSHHRIDDGDHPGGFKMSPVLLSDGKFDSGSILERFRQECQAIDPFVADFVADKIAGYDQESR